MKCGSYDRRQNFHPTLSSAGSRACSGNSEIGLIHVFFSSMHSQCLRNISETRKSVQNLGLLSNEKKSQVISSTTCLFWVISLTLSKQFLSLMKQKDQLFLFILKNFSYWRNVKFETLLSISVLSYLVALLYLKFFLAAYPPRTNFLAMDLAYIMLGLNYEASLYIMSVFLNL